MRFAEAGWIDGWALAGTDQHCIGDFDGDGLDEIYVRSPQYAGVLKWIGNRFQSQWIRQSNILYCSGGAMLPLAGQDISYNGRFLPSRDGILHRADDGVAILTWESGEMRVRKYKDRRFPHSFGGPGGQWTLSIEDNFVLGDFHHNDRTVPHPDLNRIHDHLTEVFMHNSSKTGMFGFDLPSTNPSQATIYDDIIGLMWVRERSILSGPG